MTKQSWTVSYVDPLTGKPVIELYDTAGRWLLNRGALMSPCEAAGCKRYIAKGEYYFRLPDGWGPFCVSCAERMFGAVHGPFECAHPCPEADVVHGECPLPSCPHFRKA